MKVTKLTKVGLRKLGSVGSDIFWALVGLPFFTVYFAVTAKVWLENPALAQADWASHPWYGQLVAALMLLAFPIVWGAVIQRVARWWRRLPDD